MQLHINKRNRLRMLRLDSMCLSAEIVSVIAHFTHWSNNKVVSGNGKNRQHSWLFSARHSKCRMNLQSIREDGTKSTRVSSLDDDVWEKELAKELVFLDGLSVSMDELAMHCLWEITFYGFPGSTFTRSDVEFLLGVDYGMRYDYYSVGCGTNGRLDYILESMTKYQQLDLARYDNAVVFVLYPSRYPLEDLEVEAFRKAVHKRLGYENVMFGTAVTSSGNENVKVMLLLNRTA